MIARGGFRLASGGVLAALLAAGPVTAAPIKLSVDTDVRLGYDMNPFLSPGSDVASGYVSAGIRPQAKMTTEKGSITASGHFDSTYYEKRYDQSNQYGAQLDVQQRVSPKLTVFGNLSYDSEIIGQGSFGDNVTGPPIDDTDVNLLGTRRRSDTYRASAGYQYQLSSKDMITADANYSATRYGSGPTGSDYDNIGGSIGYRRAISERTRVGVTMAAYRIEYDTPGLITWVMEPAVTFSTSLSATWRVEAQLGMSFTKLYLPAPQVDRRAKGVSGNISLCHTGTKDDFCFYGSRNVTGSGVGGTVERTQFGVNYSRRLTETLRWSGNASYARSKSQAVALDTREYLNARGGLSWQAKPWLILGADAQYRDVYGGGRQIRADYGGEISATVSLPGRK